jgi:hypothetical protein
VTAPAVDLSEAETNHAKTEAALTLAPTECVLAGVHDLDYMSGEVCV